MKKISIEQMENVNGGWFFTTPDEGGWSVAQHVGCALAGAVIGFGFKAALAYVSCLLIVK